jgi:hypothetical protein
MVSMATSDVGRKHGINTIVKLTQKDIVNIKEMQVEQDKRNLGDCSVRMNIAHIKDDWR